MWGIWVGRNAALTLFAAPVALDVIRLLALAVALWNRALEFFCVGKDYRLAGARLDQAVVNSLGH